MITSPGINRYLTRHPAIPVLIYIGLVAAFGLTVLLMLIDIADRHGAVNASAEALARLERRAPVSPSDAGWEGLSAPAGSPFLQGGTVTIASAALLERLTGAVARAGGNLVSFEVESQSAPSRNGYMKVIINCELEQEALQRLLYDIEAGMPFLFVDQLAAQAPLSANDGARMRLVLGVSGLWAGGT